MIVYRDIISGDEMLSDAFKLLPVTDTDGSVVRNGKGSTNLCGLNVSLAQIDGLMMVESKMITKSDDVDVGCGNGDICLS